MNGIISLLKKIVGFILFVFFILLSILLILNQIEKYKVDTIYELGEYVNLLQRRV